MCKETASTFFIFIKIFSNQELYMRIHNDFVNVPLYSYISFNSPNSLKMKESESQNTQLAPVSQLQTSYITSDLWGHQNTDMRSNATPVQAWAPGSRYATVCQIYR